MTSRQKEQVRLLRESGYSYGQIAQQLDLSINTVRSHCRRCQIAVIEHREIRLCRNCGLPLCGRQKLFCSRKCKTQWWNRHPKRQKGQVEKICPNCGTPFFSYPFEQRRYCSHPCYIRQRFTGNSSASE